MVLPKVALAIGVRTSFTGGLCSLVFAISAAARFAGAWFLQTLPLLPDEVLSLVLPLLELVSVLDNMEPYMVMCGVVPMIDGSC